MAPANPWLALLGQDDQTTPQPNASYDPDIQALMNAQAATSDAQQPKESNPGLDLLNSVQTIQAPAKNERSFILPNYNIKNEPGFPIEQAAIDRLKAYRDKLEAQPNKLDLTPLMALADSWNKGSNLVGSYKAPMGAEERGAKQAAIDEAIAKEGGSIAEQALKADNYNKAIQIANEKTRQGGASKDADNEEKDANKLTDYLQKEVNQGRFSPTVRAQTNVNQADRLKALLGRYKDQFGKADYNAMPLQGLASLSELAIGANNLLASGGQGSEGSRQSLIPPTAQGKYSTVEQFLSGNPTGAEMGEFVKRIEQTIDTEREVNAKQVREGLNQLQTATGTGRLARTNPKRYQAIIGAYVNAPALQQPKPDAANLKVGDIYKGHKYLGGPADDPKSWGEQ